MKEIKRCFHCEAKMVEYRHNLSKNIVSCLFVFVDRGGTIEFANVNGAMTFNQKNNFQKLQYWGLISKVNDENGRVSGVWAITSLGLAFIEGKISINKNVWTYRNKAVRFDGEKIFVTDVEHEPYRQRDDYVADERPRFVDDNGQLQFFPRDL